MLETVQRFGERRKQQGDIFEEAPAFDFDAYSYVYNNTLVVIAIWGEDPKSAISVFGCARVGLVPTLDLYRYVATWRTSVGIGAPYVVEQDGLAAVMCDREIPAGLVSSDTLRLNIAITVDLLQETQAALAADLARADGYRLEEVSDRVRGAAVNVIDWWTVSDPRISSLIGLGA
ncbi:hypothetical protein [Actinomycetospora lemnae]|uniref:SUKH-4 immunity protein of toxin-antitoxin system n=1 Tax=Actinomycetospora lemnae TaxID=3019891 RepID=A0ABT5T2W3_9PSEU|nr:hypothetical protein [Actinomycetospora sp. DW7H6]MDD7969306.1 hypothetical protein [Actinomycetospora sp. DW7H6]